MSPYDSPSAPSVAHRVRLPATSTARPHVLAMTASQATQARGKVASEPGARGVAGDRAVPVARDEPVDKVNLAVLHETLRLAPVSYTHLRAHETDSYLVCRLLLEKKKKRER